MTAALVTFDTFSFADGNLGHVCDLGTAPGPGEIDILCVNSNTVVSSTPSGFDLLISHVGNQGSYIYSGDGGSTVTITTSGNHPTGVIWSRWSGLISLDTATKTTVDTSVGVTTPAHNTGSLASAGELALAFGALHSIGTANQNTPIWSAGYTALATATNGSGPSGVRGYAGYRVDAGAAAETPQVSWSGDACFNRYMLAVTFVATAGGSTVAIGQAAEVDSATTLGRAKARLVGSVSGGAVANPVGRGKLLTAGQATSSEAARHLGTEQIVAIGQATEVDTAQAVSGPLGAWVVPHPAATHVAGGVEVTHVKPMWVVSL